MTRRAVLIPLLLLLASCGADGAKRPDVRVPHVAAIWEGKLLPGPHAHVTLAADGSGLLDGTTYAKPVEDWQTNEAGILLLRERLVELTSGDAHRSADGTSGIPVIVTADARVPWGRVVHIMNQCAHPKVQIYRLLLAARRAADGTTGFLPWVLPRFISHGTRGPTLRLKLFRRLRGTADAYTLIKLGREAEFALPPAGPDADARRGAVLANLRGAIAETMAGFGETRGEAYADIHTPPPKGPHVPYGDVASVLGLLLEQGVYPELPAAVVEAELGYRADGTAVPDDETDPPGPFVVPGFVPLHDPGRNDMFGRVKRRAKEASTESALRWLAAHQTTSGGWGTADFGAWCEGKPNEGERPEGAGRAEFDVGVSGLAVSAFLGAGYTNRGTHPYKRVVSLGLRHLKNRQDPEGCFGERTSASWIYNHAAASFAMVEAYGMTHSPIFKGSAQRSLTFIERCRNRDAVWRYGLRPGDNDTSVTGWMFLPLASAQLVNEARARDDKPPALVLADGPRPAVTAWLDRVTDAQGHVGYVTRSSGASRTPAQMQRWPREKTASLEALALDLRLLLGTAPDDARLGPLIERILARPPAWTPDGSIDMPYWRFAALALFQLEREDARSWEAALRKAVRSAQRTDGTVCTYRGSWDPVGPWGADGGRVYATAMMVLCLEAPRAYSRGFGR